MRAHLAVQKALKEAFRTHLRTSHSVQRLWRNERCNVSALQQSPLQILGQDDGNAGSGCHIWNLRGRKPPPTKFHDFRCPGEGRGRGRHLERIQGPGGKAGTERARIELLIADGGKAPRIASETGSGHFFPIGNDHLPVPLHAPPAGCGVY